MKKPVDTPRGYRQLLWGPAAGVSVLGGTTGVATMTSALATPGTIPPRSNQVFFYVEAGTVRFRDDGVAPTAQYGMPISSGFEYNGDVSLLQLYGTSNTKLSLLFVG